MSLGNDFRDIGETFVVALNISKAFDSLAQNSDLLTIYSPTVSIFFSATLSQVSSPTILLLLW